MNGSRNELSQAASYSELLRQVREAGLLRRSPSFYFWLLACSCLVLATMVLGVILLGDSLWQLPLAAGIGITMAQLGFIAHEASHREVFESGPANDRFGRIVGCLLVGISYAWWKGGHNRHHAEPNRIGKDPSISPGALVHTTEDAANARGLAAWYYRQQGTLVFVLLPLAGLNLFVQSFRALCAAKNPVAGRSRELPMLTARHGALALLTFASMPVGLALGFLATYVATFGICLAGAFIPNHVGMPLIDRDSKVDFLRRQITTSRNISGGRLMTACMGGLNYQIEHHLFPSMPRPSLPAARIITRRYCQEKEITYTEETVWGAWRQVVGYLTEIGVSAGLEQTRCPTTRLFGR